MRSQLCCQFYQLFELPLDKVMWIALQVINIYIVLTMGKGIRSLILIVISLCHLQDLRFPG